MAYGFKILCPEAKAEEDEEEVAPALVAELVGKVGPPLFGNTTCCPLEVSTKLRQTGAAELGRLQKAMLMIMRRSPGEMSQLCCICSCRARQSDAMQQQSPKPH